MSAGALSLQQLQAYGSRHDEGDRAEVVCVQFALSDRPDTGALRQAACDLLSRIVVPVPSGRGTQDAAPSCAVGEAEVRDGEDVRRASARGGVTILLASRGACGIQIAGNAPDCWMTLCCHPWFLDAEGLALLGHRMLGHLSGDTPPPAERARPYAEYAHWQGQLLLSPEARFGKQYWGRRASAFRAVTELLLEERLEAALPAPGRFRAIRLPDGMAQALSACADRYDLLPDAIVLSCWAVVLECLRPERRKDLMLAVPGRDDEEFSETIGRFSFELPVSFAIAGHAPFLSLAKAVHDQWEEADEWKECFTEQFFSVDIDRAAFRFSTRALRSSTGAQRMTWQEHLCPAFNPAGRLELVCADGGRELALCGDPHRYSDVTLSFLLACCESVLEQALDEPLRPIEGFLMPSTAVPSPKAGQVSADAAPGSVNDLLESGYRRHADRLALRHGDTALTYRDLEARVLDRAREFARMGLGRESAVALSVSCPVGRIVAALAALRIGAHFLAIPANFPDDRRDFVLDRANACALVEDRGITLLRMPVDGKGTQTGSGGGGTVHPDMLAYIIFTSGTTGQPRAVAVPHLALANQLEALAERLPIAAGERVLVRTPPGFDASLWEFLYPLTIGATLHVLDPEDAFDERAILDAVFRHDIRVVQMTPGLLRRCLHLDGDRVLSRLRYLVVGGEAFDADLVAPLAGTGVTLVNAYGPAEACINASLQFVAQDRYRRSVPIGTPLEGYRFYVLDDDLRPTPTGVVGTLFIGGIGLARGLVGAPAATARLFVPDPFAARPGARMYSSGDRVRLLPDGMVEYMGRADQQMKVNGVRIDAAEIVDIIRTDGNIKDAAVVQLDGPPSSLIACVVPKSANHFSAEALRLTLRSKLPPSMCPAKIVALPDMPLTAHGKVDHAALKEAAASRTQTAHVAPRTPTEHGVAACWGAVLNVEQVGIHDNFFLVGGHSLSFSRLIAKLRDTFGIDLPLEKVIALPSVALLAEYIDQQRHAGSRHV